MMFAKINLKLQHNRITNVITNVKTKKHKCNNEEEEQTITQVIIVVIFFVHAGVRVSGVLEVSKILGSKVTGFAVVVTILVLSVITS